MKVPGSSATFGAVGLNLRIFKCSEFGLHTLCVTDEIRDWCSVPSSTCDNTPLDNCPCTNTNTDTNATNTNTTAPSADNATMTGTVVAAARGGDPAILESAKNPEQEPTEGPPQPKPGPEQIKAVEAAAEGDVPQLHQRKLSLETVMPTSTEHEVTAKKCS